MDTTTTDNQLTIATWGRRSPSTVSEFVTCIDQLRSAKELDRKIHATSRPATVDTVFVLMGNACTVREPCGACGMSHKDAATPVWVFSAHGALCRSCAETLASVMYRAARDLHLLLWLSHRTNWETPEDVELLSWVWNYLSPVIQWDNPPRIEPLLNLMNSDKVRRRVDELQRLQVAQDAVTHRDPDLFQ